MVLAKVGGGGEGLYAQRGDVIVHVVHPPRFMAAIKPAPGVPTSTQHLLPPSQSATPPTGK